MRLLASPQARMKMITENLLFILLLLFLQTSLVINQMMNPRNCSPSICGSIHNISFPFRLKNDPKHCGYPDYELSCENNVALIYLNSQRKYKVKAINYDNFTIRLADVSIKNNTCSFPNYSLYQYNFSDGYPYGTGRNGLLGYNVAWPINFMSCPYPLNNSSFLTETNDCGVSNSSSSRHTYIQVGRTKASDVIEMCRIDQIVMTSWKFEDLKNVSVSEIHDSLLYGFELSWFSYPCSKCRQRSNCFLNEDRVFACYGESYYVGFVIFLLIIGVCIPALIIAGLTIVLLLCIAISKGGITNVAVINEPYFLELIGASYLAKNVILFPCVMGFLIYKFRRRHLSMYDEIEKFLQSDNKLMPIRYSYHDIKKMTRGFREKLGQGGYGSVYKGKLRSGHDVAIKILGKSGANGQDFMNEIATIGRIHHVNIVKLVGYCAERSKRALVFDFMPNGSLDKFIFVGENKKCLSWERKYEIAVGVARGIGYLHTGCDIQILHFDIKPHNILLDHNFNPKISDFGLAKFYSTDKNFVTMTAARGTIGYVAPELINRGFGGVSYKADVYSFGMLLMEMVGLNRNFKGNTQASRKYFPCWIYDCFEQGNDIEIGGTDEKSDDDNNDANKKIAKKMMIVALWCIQMNPGDRPSMNKVVQMLEGQVERLQVPNRPSQSPQVAVSVENQIWSTYSTDSTSLLSHDAVPSIEITVLD